MARAKKDGNVLPFRRKGNGNGGSGSSSNGGSGSGRVRKDYEKEADGTKATGRSGCRKCGGVMSCKPGCLG